MENKEIKKDEVLKLLDFGDRKKFKISGGRGAIMLLNKVLKFEEYDGLTPNGKNSIGISAWSIDIEDKNLVIEYNPGFDVFKKDEKEERYVGLPIISYKADFYVYGIGGVDRYCRILDFNTLS